MGLWRNNWIPHNVFYCQGKGKERYKRNRDLLKWIGKFSTWHQENYLNVMKKLNFENPNDMKLKVHITGTYYIILDIKLISLKALFLKCLSAIGRSGCWPTRKLQYLLIWFKIKGQYIFVEQQSPWASFLRKYFCLPLRSVHVTITLPWDAGHARKGSFLRLDLTQQEQLQAGGALRRSQLTG